jgi:hypothetical protein
MKINVVTIVSTIQSSFLFDTCINLYFIEIAEGNTVHVVRSGTNRAPAKPKTTASQEQEQPQPQQQQQQQQQQQSTPTTPSLFNLPGLSGNMNPFGGDIGMPNMDPELIRQMMDSPFMQSLLDNPGKLFVDLNIGLLTLDRIHSFHDYE